MGACFCLVFFGVLAGCAGAKVGIVPNGGDGGRGGGGNAGSFGPTIDLDAKAPTPPVPVDQGAAPIACDKPTACADFQSSPINDPKSPTAIPSNPASQFSGSPSGSGPCVTEPEDGSLFPYNWTRPRIKWTGVSGLVKITVHADIEANDLVVYTTADNWIMDKAIWDGLRVHVHESDISVTVRAASGGATTVKFQIASASAAGSIVYWAADPGSYWNQNVDTQNDATSILRGFTVGEEGAVNALLLSQVQQPSRAQSANVRKPTCIGCHSATPDSGFVAFMDNWPWDSVIAGVTKDNVGTGAELPSLSVGGLADLNKPWAGPATFSSQNWKTGKRIMVTTSAESSETTPWSTDTATPAKLVWYNLDSDAPSTLTSVGANQQPIAQLAAGNYGIIDRGADNARGAAFATWSHDGSNIIYSSTNGGCKDGRLQQGATDLYMVPYNGGSGGEAKPVPGASDPKWEEYYAAYAPDDSMVLFDRVPSGGVMYANPAAEMYFAPLGSAPGAGTAVRLNANDPVACTGKTSPNPGVNNHFPKWAPAAQTYNNRTYYWVIYSSNRAGLPPVTGQDGTKREISQLYLTAISVEGGTYKTYKSIYLWWQMLPSDKNPTVNTTPVWDMITIPPAQPIY
jgi:hypothetical protein